MISILARSPQSLSPQSLSIDAAVKQRCSSSVSKMVLALPVLWGFAFSPVAQAFVFENPHRAEPFSETEMLPEGEFRSFDRSGPALPLELSQLGETTLIRIEANTHAIRILERPGGGIFMNVFNRVSGVQQPNGRPARVLSSGESGVLSYASNDFLYGQPATYIVRIYGDNSAELDIIGSSGSSLLQDSGTVSVSNVEPGMYPPPLQASLLEYQGREFSARVFEQERGTLMNVFNRRTGSLILESQPAYLDAPRSENDAWRSYVSQGTYRGRPAAYYARVSPQGQAQLEVFDSTTGALLLREDGYTPETRSNPDDMSSAPTPPPNAATSPYPGAGNYVVAVPGIDRLDEVRTLYPEAYLDRSSRGDFVNVGAFSDRGDAELRTQALQAAGINARVVHRQIDYN